MNYKLNSELIKGSVADKKTIVEVCDSVSSTNSVLKTRGESGCTDTVALISASQTSGKGRLDRKFFSPEGTGLYLSILLHPDIKPENCLFLTTTACVAACRTIERVTGIQTQIKWVNDLYIGNRKIAGILTESAIDSVNRKLLYTVVGIGINVYSPENGFPPEIAATASSLFNIAEYRPGITEALAAGFINDFSDSVSNFDSEKTFEFYREKMFLCGKTVTVVKSNGSNDAKVISLNRDYSLKVQYISGEFDNVSSGEVSLKIPQDE